MLAVLRRGDTVVTSSGLVGKISKVLNDNEVQVELAEGVRVRMLKAAVIEVRTRGEPVKDSDDADDAPSEAGALGDAIEGGRLDTDEGRDAAAQRQAAARQHQQVNGASALQKSKGPQTLTLFSTTRSVV